MDIPLTSPVALFIFNRPSHTESVFKQIARARPQKLFIVGDGPRPHAPQDYALVQECRELVSMVDWECEVMSNYSQVNLGCRNRVSTGLDWVFLHTDEAIILEDDCLPSQDFFKFTSQMLERFRGDTRVASIAGTNPVSSSEMKSDHYLFSVFPAVWGWATWSRVWKNYDPEIRNWVKERNSGFLDRILQTKKGVRYWTQALDSITKRGFDTWDFQFTFMAWENRMLTVVPSCNLVSNIGFGPEATHTVNNSSPFANQLTRPMKLPVVEKFEVSRDLRFDFEVEQLKYSRSITSFLTVQVFQMLPGAVQRLIMRMYLRTSALHKLIFSIQK